MPSDAWVDMVELLVDVVPGRGEGRVRNQALVAVLCGTGVTLAEALAVRVGDVHGAAGEIRIRGDRPRRVPLLPEMQRATLDRWASHRRRRPADTLFCTAAGGPLAPSYVRRLLAESGRRAGVRGVNARLLRRLYIEEHLAEGATVAEVATLIGHSSTRPVERALRKSVSVRPPPTLPFELVRALLDVARCGLVAVRAKRGASGEIEDFTVVYLNAAAAARLGVDQENAFGESVSAIAPGAPASGVYGRWRDIIETQGETSDERHSERSGGRHLVTRRAIGDVVVLSFIEARKHRDDDSSG